MPYQNRRLCSCVGPLQMLKPQVERRRRERMNRSLENLRILLAQGHEQQVRHTVLLFPTDLLTVLCV